jgi:hypothetical protein
VTVTSIAATQDRLASLGYSARDRQRMEKVRTPEDIASFVTAYAYADDWRKNYRVSSVRSSLHAARVNCIDAAILAYGLLDAFPALERWLLAIHRRGEGEECGHVVALYRYEGRYGAFSKSSYEGLRHRPPVHASPHAVARSFAQAYLRMGFEPLYYGTSKLEELAGDLDWRFSEHDLSVLSNRLVASYEYAFDVGAQPVAEAET